MSPKKSDGSKHPDASKEFEYDGHKYVVTAKRPKFVQICASGAALFGLDKDGEVWLFQDNVGWAYLQENDRGVICLDEGSQLTHIGTDEDD